MANRPQVWFYSSTKPQRAGWFALNQDNGFVSPDAFGTTDIACHKSATAGTTEIPVTAGSTVTLTWNTWPESHHGPVIDYLAKCSGACTSAKAGDLSFFKIQQSGLVDGSTPPGKWGTDTLMANGLKWNVKIPSTIAAGSYVLRHELIGLHSAGSQNGAQNYPQVSPLHSSPPTLVRDRVCWQDNTTDDGKQCINFKVASSGTANPAGTKGNALYKATDPGILINIYQKLTSYIVPGPSTVVSKREAVPFEA